MARRKQPATHAARLRALLDTGLGHLLVRTTVAALVFLLAGIVMRQARAYTYALEDFRVGASSLRFTGLPRWADGRIRRSLDPRAFRAFSVSIYDPDAEAIVRGRVERHPLVRGVRHLELLYPNEARVAPILRVPVARVCLWVPGRDGFQVRRWRLLSDDGCLLPRRPYRAYLEGLPYELPVVTGIRERAPLDPGEIWEDRTERVKEAVAAAKLAPRLFREFRERVTLQQVDVSRFPATVETREAGEVRLVLSCPPERRGGARVDRTVEWGRTDRARSEVAFEDGYTTKVRRLWAVLTSADPPEYVDVRWPPQGTPRTAP